VRKVFELKGSLCLAIRLLPRLLGHGRIGAREQMTTMLNIAHTLPPLGLGAPVHSTIVSRIDHLQ